MDVVFLNQIGLLSGLVGTTLVFFWGPPQPKLDGGVGLALEDGTVLDDGRTVADHNKRTAQLRRRHEVISRIGMGLIVVAFGLQFVATVSG